MDMMIRLQQEYESYIEKVQDVWAKASYVDGLFGLGDDPRKHYCHDAFYDNVGAWTEEFRKTTPDSGQALEAVRWMLGAAALHRGEKCYWYLFAAQGHTRGLIPRLESADCKELVRWYDETYPKLDRMPVQNEVYKLLKKRSGKKWL